MTNFRAEIKRGKIIESIHEAKCVIKDSNFNIILSSNNEKDLVFPRSSIKIFQAIPFIISGAHKKYNLGEKYIAMSCASHCGEKFHLRVLENWINSLNLNPKDLLCGIHNPINKKSSNSLLLSGVLPTQLHNNCAGKHLAMISGCLCKKFNYKNYVDLDHPYQKLIRKSLEYFADEPVKKKQIGIDGCSAPQYAFTMNALANSMINLVSNDNKNEYTKSSKIILNSIRKNPLLIGGTKRFDSEVIKYTKGRIFCKGGAEGVMLFADLKKKIGGIIKIKDGNERAIPPLTMKIFTQLNLLSVNEKKQLSSWIKPKIFNHANKKIGEIIT